MSTRLLQNARIVSCDARRTDPSLAQAFSELGLCRRKPTTDPLRVLGKILFLGFVAQTLSKDTICGICSKRGGQTRACPSNNPRQQPPATTGAATMSEFAGHFAGPSHVPTLCSGAGGFALTASACELGLTASVCRLGLSLAAARVPTARLDALRLFVAAAQLVGFVAQANVAF